MEGNIMAMNLKGKSFLTLLDFSTSEIRYLLDLAHDLKYKKRAGVHTNLLLGKNIVLIFEKTSTRTRCSFEVAAAEEGGHATYLDISQSQMGKKESLEDTAKVLGRYYDGIEYRGYDQEVVENLAKHSGVPVWNGLTDVDHPTQILADMMTMEEHLSKPLHHSKVVFCGDIKNNMAYAWMYGCAKMGMHFVGYGPKELVPDQKVLDKANEIAKETGAIIEICSDTSCLDGADVLYTDVWVSMGEEDRTVEKVNMLSPYKVTMDLLAKTNNSDVMFMHCLPAYHDFETKTAKDWMAKGLDIREVEDEVFRNKNSVVFDEAENRMHTIKAVIVATIA
jgi:ornithine carbamoyltransferase